MSLLQWKSEYSIGIESMDHEHRQMIELINGLYRQLDVHSGRDDIEACLGDIFNAIAGHFALEERLMRDAGYDRYAEHKDDHEDLLDELTRMMDVFAHDPESGVRQLQSGLSEWFSRHFATHDARLHGRLGV